MAKKPIVKFKFDPVSSGSIGQMTLPSGKTVLDLLRENNATYDSRLPHSLLSRKGFGTDITACFGFTSSAWPVEDVRARIISAGCHPARAFQGIAIAVIAHRHGKLLKGRSYVLIDEQVEAEGAQFFLRIWLKEGRLHVDLFPVEEFIDYLDFVCISVRAGQG